MSTLKYNVLAARIDAELGTDINAARADLGLVEAPGVYVPSDEEFYASSERRRRKTGGAPCVVDEAPQLDPDAAVAPLAEPDKVVDVPSVLDSDSDSDSSQFPIGTGDTGPSGDVVTLAEDGLPKSHLGTVIRRFKGGTLNPATYGDDWINVPLQMPRGAALRSLAYWFKVCFELRLNCGEAEPMGFAVSMGCTLLGLDYRDRGHRSNVSRDIHRLEDRSVIKFAYTVPVRGRKEEMRCFLPVGINLDALLEPQAELTLVERAA